jgi:hypothetical protein
MVSIGNIERRLSNLSNASRPESSDDASEPSRTATVEGTRDSVQVIEFTCWFGKKVRVTSSDGGKSIRLTGAFVLDLIALDLWSLLTAFGAHLASGVMEIWDTVGLVRYVAMTVTSLAFCHNFVLCIMHVLYRDAINYLEFFVLQFCNIICLLCVLRLYYWDNLTVKEKRRYLQMIMLGCGVCVVMDFVVNALPGRSSEMALFDATLFCVCSFLCLRGTLLKAIFIFSPCFSWHFWKRALPWLMEERSCNLFHLLYAISIYCISIYLSTVFDAYITLAIERKKILLDEHYQGTQRLQRRRQHQPRT